MSYVTIGPYVAGIEIPEAWVHAWDDALGADVDLTGFTVDVQYRVNGGPQVVLAAEASLFDGATGRTIVTWSAADFATAGLMAGELVVAGGGLRLAQGFQCVILPPRGGTGGAAGSPGVYDLVVYQGDGLSFGVLLADGAGVPLDTTPAYWAAQWRPSPGSATFENFGIVETEPGRLLLSLTGEQTARMSTGRWDLENRPPVGERRTVLAGAVTVTVDVTRA